MQLIEYFVWTYYGNSNVNYIASICASVLLNIQPIGAILTLYKQNYKLMILLLFIYFIIQIISIPYYILSGNYSREKYRMYKGNNGHLVWNWISKKNVDIIPLICYFFFFLYPIIISANYTIIFFNIFTLLLSLIIFYKTDTWSTMWCWYVNFGFIFYILSLISHKYF